MPLDFGLITGHWQLTTGLYLIFTENYSSKLEAAVSRRGLQASKDFRNKAIRELNMRRQRFKPLSDVARSLVWVECFGWDYGECFGSGLKLE